MSLNASEVDLIVSELSITGGYIQKVIQSDFKNLYFSIYGHGQASWIRVCLEHPWVRFHRSGGPRSKRSHQRFEEFLHSRVNGAQITDVVHVHHDRIVKFSLRRNTTELSLFLRLWGTRANVIVTETDGTILDAMLRKPNEGIISGARFIPHPPQTDRPARPVRDFDHRQSFNEYVAASYAALESQRDRERLITACRRTLEREIRRLETRYSEVKKGAGGGSNADQFRRYGDLILANVHRISKGAEFVDVEDYEEDMRDLRIELDPRRSASANASFYYEKAKNLRENTTRLAELAQNVESRLGATRERQQHIDSLSDAELRMLLDELPNKRDGRSQRESEVVGLRFTSHGFEIIVGRNARENDHLLRRSVRGNDWWLHTRDVPGGYVFIRNKPGKSVPLDVLLDAGNLAVFFSKARSSGRADLFYTQVKYLRRPREGPVGLVLPTQEKNISAVLDNDRLARLGIGGSL